MKTAKKYFDREYGNTHLKEVVLLQDMDSLYGLIEEYHKSQSIKLIEAINNLESTLKQIDQ